MSTGATQLIVTEEIVENNKLKLKGCDGGDAVRKNNWIANN